MLFLTKWDIGFAIFRDADQRHNWQSNRLVTIMDIWQALMLLNRWRQHYNLLSLFHSFWICLDPCIRVFPEPFFMCLLQCKSFWDQWNLFSLKACWRAMLKGNQWFDVSATSAKVPALQPICTTLQKLLWSGGGGGGGENWQAAVGGKKKHLFQDDVHLCNVRFSRKFRPDYLF